MLGMQRRVLLRLSLPKVALPLLHARACPCLVLADLLWPKGHTGKFTRRIARLASAKGPTGTWVFQPLLHHSLILATRKKGGHKAKCGAVEASHVPTDTVTNKIVEDGFEVSEGNAVWRIPVLPDDQDPSMELVEDPSGIHFIAIHEMKAGTEISVSLDSYEKYGAQIEGKVCSKGRVKFDLSRSRPPDLTSIEGINLKTAQAYQVFATMFD